MIRPLGLALLFAGLFSPSPARSQPAAPGDSEPEVARTRILQVAPAESGDWVMSVRIFASSQEPLRLFKTPKGAKASAQGADDPQPLSLSGSTLRDLYTQKLYSCREILPRRPFFGPMEVTLMLQPGGWYQMGIAFPAIPAPPPDSFGQPQPYQLLFSIPQLNLETWLTLDPQTLEILERKKLSDNRPLSP